MAAEKLFENKIKKYLKDNGDWYVKFFANSYTKSGIPDILACSGGYFLAIEVKAPNGKPSELQKYNVQSINKCGGFAVIVRPDQWSLLKTLIDTLSNFQRLEAQKVVKEINALWEV